MKTFMIFFLSMASLFPGYKCFAQTDVTQSSKIALAVLIPSDMENLNESQKSKLQSKMMQLCSNSGFAATADASSGIVIYPKFAVMDKSVVEGMENISTVKAEITLVIQNIVDNTVFSSYTKQVVGTGVSESAAKDNAIMRFSATDKEMQDFIVKGKQKVLDYYNNKCTEILAKADGYVKMKQYEQALALLTTIPVEASACYSKAQAKVAIAFQLYSNQNCREKLNEAKALIANRSFSDALYTLSSIDPTSTCSADVKSLIQATSVKVDAVDKREWDFKLKLLSTTADVAKARYNAIANVMGAYFKSQQLSINVIK